MTEEGASGLLSPAAIDAGYRAAEREIGQFNLGLFGLTGAGKSTLLNAVFGVNLAATGIGAPVTQTSTLHRRTTNSLGIFDTKGLELGTRMDDTLAELRTFVDANRLGPESDQLHVIWYCIRAGDRRIQPAEQAFIRGVAGIGIPVVLVMTQVPLTPAGQLHPEAVELATAIRGLRLPTRGDIFFVNALGDDFGGIPVHGLDALLQWTEQIAPEGVRNALAAAQQVNTRFKAARAASVVTRAANVVRSKALKRNVTGEAWVAMFAEIATIYGLSEAQSRQVLENSDIIARLRRLVMAANAGVFLMPAVALVGMTATAVADSGRRAGSKWKARRQAKRDDGSGGKAVEAQGDPGSLPEKKSVGVGWVAARITRDLGAAWTTTCEHYWSQAYPEPPTALDTSEVAGRFNAELQHRLPRPLRRGDRRG